MYYAIQVENIKCGGCANTIRKQLIQLASVDAVEVVVESGIVRITGDRQQRDQVAEALRKLGYPETGSVEGLQAAGARAKSFVSCAVGRLSD